MKKRILSLVLAVLMIATLLPVSASALTMSRDDGTWLFPAPSSYYNAFSDWAGCPGKGKCWFCGTVHSGWGDRWHTSTFGHNGVDIGVPYGTNVYAAASGTIYWKNTNWGARGYTVVIEHPTSNGYSYYSYYQHLSNVTLKPNKSQVAAGDIIAKSGNSGGDYEAHLHFGIVIASPGLGEKMADMTTNQLNIAEGQGWLTTTGKTMGRILTNPSAKSQVPTGDPAVVPPLKAHMGSVTYTFDKSKVTVGNAKITVTFNANGGSCSTSTKSISKGGSLGSLPTPTRTNYTFEGWYTAASGGTKISASTTFSSNTTVYAHWTINTAKVTLYNADKSVWQSTSANYGSSYTLPSTYPAKDGYYFCGWSYTDGAADYDIRPTEKLTISGAVNFYPVFVSYDKVVSGDVVYIYNVDDFDDDAYTAKEKTVDTTVEEDASYWGSWSTYTTSAVSPSSTRQVRTATLYRYYYFLCPSCGAHEPFWGTSDCGKAIPSSAWHEKWSTTPYSKSNYQKFSYTSARYYTTSLGDGQLWIFGSANLNDTAVGTIDSGSEAVVIKTGYSYRDYIKKTNTKTVSRTGYVFELTGCKHNYTAQSVAATDSEPEHVLYTCKECGDTYKEYLGNWSDWAAKLPGSVTSDSHDIETKTLYRYRDNTTTTQYGDWSASKTTTSKPTESNTLRITATKTFYNYYHYCCNYYDGMNNVDSISYGSGSHHYHTLKTTSQLSATSVADKGGKTLYGNSACSCNFYLWAQAGTFKTYEYTYQTRTATQVTTEGSWSAWQETKPESKTNRDIETATNYRYKLKTYAVTYDANGGTNAPVSTVKAHNAAFKLSSTVPTRDGYNFLGWTTVKDGTVTYKPGDTYSGNNALSLYAKWEKIHTHTWDNGTVTKAATCTANGVKTFSCTGCSETKTAVISALGHIYENGKCTHCGAADPTVPIKVAVGEVGGYTGETVTVPVIVSDNNGFSQFTFKVSYNSSALTLTDITKGEVLKTSDSGAFTVDAANNTVSYTDSVNIESDGTLLYLTFKVSDSAAAGKYDVAVKADSFKNDSGKSVNNSIAGGKVSIAKSVSTINAGCISVSDASARAGEEVTVSVSLSENPGIMVMVLGIDYDRSKLTLVGHEDAGFTGWTVANNAVWLGDSNSTYNGVILKLRFKVLEGVEDGDIQINMLYSIGDIANYDEEVICPDVKAGTITVGSVIPGDFTGDGVVNALDLLRLKKFLAGDNAELACSGDVTGDGVVNALDLLRVKKFLAGDNVELH